VSNDTDQNGEQQVLIQSLKIFCDLVDTQSFSKTAVLNDVTQSAVSQQIKSIEKRQGVLLERHKRNITLTEEGDVFYKGARDIVRRYEEMLHRVEALDGVVSGTVRLSSIYSVGMRELGPFLQKYLKTYPKVNFRLAYNKTQKIYDDVSSSEIDFGIVAYPRSRRNIRTIPFTEDQMVVVSHPKNPLAKKKIAEMKDLSEHPLILFSQETYTRQAIDRYLRKNKVQPNIAMELDHIDTIKDAVEVDLGISILPSRSVELERAEGSLTTLDLRGDALIRPLGILHKQGRSFSVAAQKLLEVLTDGKEALVSEISE
jgi:DNA-binding transcriptional LysR family regulator